MAQSPKDWRSTATLLRGALDRVERHIQSDDSQTPSPSPMIATQSAFSEVFRGRAASINVASAGTSASTSGVSDIRTTPTSTRSEFSRLFGYRPDVSQKKQHTSRKRKFPRGTFSSQKRARISTWKKETVCLRYKDQAKAPDTLEKMELAKLGLGLKELSFDADSDAMHIHGVLLEAFKELAHCGGYTLLRLAANSTYLFEIEPPKGGMTVRYLRDIIKSAKLFIRPLQADIESNEHVDTEVCIEGTAWATGIALLLYLLLLCLL